MARFFFCYVIYCSGIYKKGIYLQNYTSLTNTLDRETQNNLKINLAYRSSILMAFKIWQKIRSYYYICYFGYF